MALLLHGRRITLRMSRLEDTIALRVRCDKTGTLKQISDSAEARETEHWLRRFTTTATT
jgi:hypothetical protein